MNASLLSFNLALSRIARIGYHKSVMAFNLVGAPLQPQAALMRRSGEERSAPRPKQAHPQLHRTNRLTWRPEDWKAYARRLASKAAYNKTYNARRRELRRLARERGKQRSQALHMAKLQQRALALEGES